MLAKPIPDQQGRGQRFFSFDVSQGGATFSDPDGDPLTYFVTIYSNDNGPPVVGSTIAGRLQADSAKLFVEVLVQDGRGGFARTSFYITVVPNSPPSVVSPNLVVMSSPGTQLNYDPTKGGATFADAEGDPLTYRLDLISPSRGLAVSGTRVVGSLAEVGATTFELVAIDSLGAESKDRFSIVVAAPEPGVPTLPSTSYAYADKELPLPGLFANGGFGDSTPGDNPTTDAGATLGRVLFYDKRLSVTNTHACASCHHQDHGFAGPERFPVGVQNVPLRRNAMALGNVRSNYLKRWFADQRASSLQELALMPIQEPAELGNYLPVLEAKLTATSFYPPLFEAAFGSREITSERIAKALAQFLQSLLSYRSRHDDAYLYGPLRAELLSQQEVDGREVFMRSPGPRCGACHIGEQQTMFSATSNGLDPVITDPGVMGPAGPTGWFRAASLRNIAVTGPYMHDGRFVTLREVIDHYDHGVQDSLALADELRESRTGPPKQLNLSEEEKSALEAFLRTLTDDAFLSDPKFADPFL